MIDRVRKDRFGSTTLSYIGSTRGIYCILALILFVALFLRLEEVKATYVDSIKVTGSALEYKQLADHILEPQAVPPPGNPLGLSLIMVPFFAVLPFSHDAIQVGISLTASMGSVLLIFFFCRGLVGPFQALIVAALTAVNTTMINNAPRGLTEELYTVSLLVVLGWYRTIIREVQRQGWAYIVLGLLVGWMILVRKDGLFLILPLFATLLYDEFKSRGLYQAVRVLFIPILLPFAMIMLGNWYQDAEGIKSAFWRGARAYFWFDFFRGRMPWEYMFYGKINLMDWWFGFHDLSEMLLINLRSSVRTVLALGEALGGQLVLGLSLFGMVTYLRKEREVVVLLAVPLSILPQFLWIYFSSEVDMFRYIVRVLPLLILFVVYGGNRVGELLARALGGLGRMQISPRVTFLAVLIVLLGSSRSAFSLYKSVRPQVSCQTYENYHRIGSEIHPELVKIWGEFTRDGIINEEQWEKLRLLRDRLPVYAPTYLVSGLIALHEGNIEQAKENLEKAVDIVPFFAEAGIWLAEIYALQGRMDDALELLQKLTQVRTDFPPLFLLQGNLYLVQNSFDRAIRAYDGYFAALKNQTGNALDRLMRHNKQAGLELQVSMIADDLKWLKQADYVFLSPILWKYLSLDLKGLNVRKPYDQDALYNFGMSFASSGVGERMAQVLQRTTELTPNIPEAWINLAMLHARSNALGLAGETLVKGAETHPRVVQVWLSLGSIQAAAENWEAAAASYEEALELDSANVFAERMVELARVGNWQVLREESANKWPYAERNIVLPMTGAKLPAPRLRSQR